MEGENSGMMGEKDGRKLESDWKGEGMEMIDALKGMKDCGSLSLSPGVSPGAGL